MSDTTTPALDTQVSALGDADWGDLSLVNGFWDVAFTQSEHDQLVSDTNSDPFWATTGVQSVISAWNSAAYDDANNTFYFFGGGHNNYGGNEVYSLDLDTMVWTRLTEPSPVDFTTTAAGEEIGLPRQGPISPHTYDGLVWNETTQTMWLTSTYTGFGGPAPSPDQKAVWEFDPATGDWTAHDSSSNMKFGSSVYLPDTGQTLSLHNASRNDVQASLFEADGSETFFGQVAGLQAATTAFRHPDTGEIYTIAVDTIERLTVGPNAVTTTTAANLPTVSDLNTTMDFSDAGYAYRPVDGKFYIWNGGEQIVTWDPASNDFGVVWNQGDQQAPDDNLIGAGRVFDKWVYVQEQDAFVGISSADDGMFVWKPGDNPAEVNQPNVGTIQLDYQTTGALGVFVPLLDGDKNYDSSAEVWYRAEGASSWQPAMDLLRIRPELNQAGQESPEGYAGSIFGLDPGQRYEIKVEVSDADGVQGTQMQSLTAATKDVPARDPANATVVDVYDAAGLQAALNSAAPGHVIQVNPGTYTLSDELRLDASGTADNPIVIRGLDRSSTIIDAQDGRGLFIKGDHVSVEDLSITNTSEGITFRNADAVTIRGNFIQVNDSDDRGQQGIKGTGDDAYIVDNILEGPFPFGQIDTGGADRGIDVGGHNVEIAYNTLSGFLDAIAGANDKSVGVEIHHNEVLWSTDNGIELDHGLRNISAHHNRLSNTTDALSAQTVAGGPAYIFDNVLLNVGNSPMKVKPLGQEQSQGIYFVNNTIVKEGLAWGNDSGTPSQMFVLNNLFLGQGNNDKGDTLRNLSDHRLTEMDHNAWLTDGRFRIDLADRADIAEASFADFQANTQFAEHSLLLANETVFANYTLDFDQNGFLTFRDPAGTDFTLDSNSSAVDAAVLLANINDAYTGAAPDIGAVETGDDPVQYGARITLQPATAPIAGDDTADSSADQPVTVDVLANDFDPNGDALTVIDVSAPAHGSATITDSGRVTYSPTAGYVGGDSFTYTIQDPGGETATGTVTVSVLGDNNAPTAGDDSLSAVSGETVQIAASTLLPNDADVDGDPLTITGVDAGAGGTVSLSGSTITFRVSDGYEGGAGFAYTLSDGHGGNATGNVAIQVTANGAITGSDTRDVIDVSTADSGQVVDALGGHDDVIGSAYADEITGGAGQDTLEGGAGDDVFHVVGDGGINEVDGGTGYDTIRGSAGDDVVGLRSLSGVEAIDTGGGYDVVRGSGSRDRIDFSSMQIAGVDLIDGAGGHDILIGSTGQNSIRGGAGFDEIDGGDGTDRAVFDGNYADYAVTQGADRITVEALVTGERTDKLYNVEILQFADGQWANGTFTAGATDFGDADTTIVTLAASDDAVQASEDTPVTLDPTGNDTLTSTAAVASVGQAAHGQAVLQEDGLVAYTPDADYAGSDSFSYTLRDDTGQTSSATVAIDVAPVNDAPVTVDDAATATEQTAQTIDVLANDSDVDGDALTVAGVSGVTDGSVQINTDGTLAYTPDAGSAGSHSFTYTASDGAGGETTGQVAVEVSAPEPTGPTARWTGTSFRDIVDLSAANGGHWIDGLGGHDEIVATAFADWIATGEGSDSLSGGYGDDLFLASATSVDGFDAIDGGGGFDTLKGDAADNVIGLESLVSVERIDGGGGADVLLGRGNRDHLDLSGTELVDIELIDTQGGHDIVTGSAGDDHYRGGAGWDDFNGGAGFDTVYFDSNFADYTVTGGDGSFTVEAHATSERTDDLTNVEALRFADGIYEDGSFTLVGIADDSAQLVYDVA